MGGVDVIRNGNEAYTVSGKHPSQIASGFYVLTAQSG